MLNLNFVSIFALWKKIIVWYINHAAVLWAFTYWYVSSQIYVNSQQQVFMTRSNMIFSANAWVIYVNYCHGQVPILVDIKVQSSLFFTICANISSRSHPDLSTACYAGTMIIISSEANKAWDFNLVNDLVC